MDKKFRFIITIVFVFLCSVVIGQHYPDRVMVGHKSSVKKVITTSYGELVLKDSVWQPWDIFYFSSQIINYYNPEGFLDSMFFSYLSKEGIVTERIICKYSGKIKTGSSVYLKSVLQETFTIDWIDKYNYIQQHYDALGKPIMEYKIKLSDSLREHIGEFKKYDSLGKLEEHTISEFVIINNEWSTKIIKKDLLNDTVTVTNINLLKFDDNKNPRRIECIKQGETKPERLSVRVLEYY